MGAYVDLSQTDKDILGAADRNLRGWINDIISRGTMQARALQAAFDAGGGAVEILAGLDAGEVVPNTGSIEGAHDLTKEEIMTLKVVGLDGYVSSYDTLSVRELAAKAAGPTAGL